MSSKLVKIADSVESDELYWPDLRAVRRDKRDG